MNFIYIKPFQALNELIWNLRCIILLISSSDSQASFRRQASERRDHDNALLVNYDGSIGSQQAKYGGSQLL
jgi:hypothetical protein